MIGAEEIAGMRADAEANLPDEGRVLVHGSVSDGAGGEVESYTPGVELRCAIAPLGQGGAARTAGDKVVESGTHVVTFPAATDVKAVDRVEVAGVVYVVTALRVFGALSITRRVEVRAL